MRTNELAVSTLNQVVGNYVEAFDEGPPPVAVADRADDRLLKLLTSLDLRTNADRRLADHESWCGLRSVARLIKPADLSLFDEAAVASPLPSTNTKNRNRLFLE